MTDADTRRYIDALREVVALSHALSEIRRMHIPAGGVCVECATTWPCPTRRAAGGEG